MRSDEGTPYILRKDKIIGSNSFFHNHVLINEVYQSDFKLDKLHFHDFIEISFVSAGSGVHRVWSDSCECKKGDINIIQIGTPHAYFARSNSLRPVVRNILFDASDLWNNDYSFCSSPNFCRGVFRKNSMIAHVSVHGEEYDLVVAIFDLIQKEISTQAQGWKEVIQSQINTLLIIIGRLLNCAEGITYGKEQEITLDVMHYVAANYSDPSLTLRQVAQRNSISQSSLSRYFLQVTGTHFSEYLRKVRMRHACILLTQEPLSVEQVANRCGYSDLPSFYKLFKKIYGVTPHQYKIMHRS